MRILSCFAHPDDETILAGGLLALLDEAGHEVHYLCCTRGEGGECGDPPVCDQDDLGSVRQEELKCAVKCLGGKSLHFLDYQDPKVGIDNILYSFTDDTDTLERHPRQGGAFGALGDGRGADHRRRRLHGAVDGGGVHQRPQGRLLARLYA